ncbi:MAG: ABC transporter permease [Myxococcales bacterium]|nr:ABC transporter permease [Myxococcales bacterium]
MSVTRPRLAVITLVASRFLLREDPPSKTSLRVLWIAVAVAIAATVATLAGAGSMAVPLSAVVASLVAVGMICVRVLMPAVAVAVFGMALGCAALTTVLAVTTGFERELTVRMTRMNGHVLVTKYGLSFTEYPELADKWRRDPRVVAASPFAYAMAAIVPVGDPEAAAEEDDAEGEGRRRGPKIVSVKGLDPQAAAPMRGLREIFESGELTALRPGDTRYIPGIALGYRLADRLGVAVGDRVSLVLPAELDGNRDVSRKPPRHATFEVLDRLDTGVTDLDNNLALVHLSAGQALFFAKARVTGVELELRDAGLAPAVAGELDEGLPPEFRATSWQQQSEPTLAGLRQVRVAVSVVIGLLEVVAASALVASLLLLIRRKQPAIAVLMAIGSDARLIFLVFEAIGGLAGLVGALVGVALGASYAGLIAAFRYPLQDDVYPIDHLPVALGAWDLLGPALAAVLICVLVSGPVAIVAAKVPVLRGLGRA